MSSPVHEFLDVLVIFLTPGAMPKVQGRLNHEGPKTEKTVKGGRDKSACFCQAPNASKFPLFLPKGIKLVLQMPNNERTTSSWGVGYAVLGWMEVQLDEKEDKADL